ncbi:MAG: hypothetical protein HY313_00015 [Acidobacteria bacterium]|nr:hypothetical protein [Acidobacteriota bacterium]
MSWWNSIESVDRFVFWTSVAVLALGGCAGVASVLSFIGTRRAETLRTEENIKLRQQLKGASESAREANRQLAAEQQAKKEAEERRRTPPKFDAVLEPDGNGKFRVRITSNNLIPFEFWYVITTKNGRLVSGFPLEATKLFPTAERYVFFGSADIELDKVVDGYLEFSFKFKSLSADELNLPQHAGEIIRKYKVSADGASLQALP